MLLLLRFLNLLARMKLKFGAFEGSHEAGSCHGLNRIPSEKQPALHRPPSLYASLRRADFLSKA